MLVNDFNFPIILSWLHSMPTQQEHSVHVNRCLILEGMASKQWDINILASIQKLKLVVGIQVYSLEWANSYSGSRIPKHMQANMDKSPLVNHSLALIFLVLHKGYIFKGQFLVAHRSQRVVHLVYMGIILLLLYSNTFSVTPDIKVFELGMVNSKSIRNLLKPPLSILSYNRQFYVPLH